MIVLVDPDTRFQSRVSDHIGQGNELVLVDSIPRLEKTLHDRGGRVNVVILGPNLPIEESYAVGRRMQTSSQDVSVILVANALTAEVFQQAMRSGIRDVLPAAFTAAQLGDAVSIDVGPLEHLWQVR